MPPMRWVGWRFVGLNRCHKPAWLRQLPRRQTKWCPRLSRAGQVSDPATIGAVALMGFIVGVSFARTPVAEVSAKAAEIEALGWREIDRADPWSISFRKDVPEEDADPTAEVRAVMGDYWLDADETRALLDRT